MEGLSEEKSIALYLMILAFLSSPESKRERRKRKRWETITAQTFSLLANAYYFIAIFIIFFFSVCEWTVVRSVVNRGWVAFFITYIWGCFSFSFLSFCVLDFGYYTVWCLLSFYSFPNKDVLDRRFAYTFPCLLLEKRSSNLFYSSWVCSSLGSTNSIRERIINLLIL